jgi:hypothetical protein
LREKRNINFARLLRFGASSIAVIFFIAIWWNLSPTHEITMPMFLFVGGALLCLYALSAIPTERGRWTFNINLGDPFAMDEQEVMSVADWLCLLLGILSIMTAINYPASY